jgi:thioredoxin 1
MKHRSAIALILVVLALTAYYVVSSRAGGVPSFFDLKLTYAAALEKSRATGKPVFALASADWCGPCHQFEDGPLADPRVVQWLTTNTVPLFLDVTSPSSPGAPAGAELGVKGIPAIFLIKDGRPTGHHEGTMDADSLLNWLATFAIEPPTPTG